ncbi:unnamed protein product [Vitrella brassicaformis CCMP3155]|uniref:Helicase ATP-binding domain-containing protein n=2 Tax=Vitrella brassicaformis TaxID=1169539 RepID=A0A0G4ESA8_VITBC|nr:unnamed protein product [Vitrella brassicaformis CCMP3155]|eukprot:CEM01510.1 unnamed protein product [Vitrella brassicaformis CCMP3155]
MDRAMAGKRHEPDDPDPASSLLDWIFDDDDDAQAQPAAKRARTGEGEGEGEGVGGSNNGAESDGSVTERGDNDNNGDGDNWWMLDDDPLQQNSEGDEVAGDVNGMDAEGQDLATPPDPLAALPNDWSSAVGNPLRPFQLQQEELATQRAKHQADRAKRKQHMAAVGRSAAAAIEIEDSDCEGQDSDGANKGQAIAAADADSELMRMVSSSTLVAFGNPHPAVLAESATLNAVKLPPLHPSQEIFIPKWVIDHGLLSSTQLESFICACRRSDKLLPSGMRAAYVLGDGTGSGKGRGLAAFLGHVNNKSGLRHNKRHVWFSISPDLKMDAERDIKDLRIGLKMATMTGMRFESMRRGTNRSLLQDQLGSSDGVLFSTYAMLVGYDSRSAKKPKEELRIDILNGHTATLKDPELTRVGMIYEWLGGADAEGAIIFDESHKAKDIAPYLRKSGAGSEHDRGRRERPPASSMTSVVACKLQEMCAKAHVIYASATAASELMNLGYMLRLGLWGPGTPYESLAMLHKSISHNAVSGMECLTINMKCQGMLSSRTISYKGCSFDVLKVPHDGEFTRLYARCCSFWQEMYFLMCMVTDSDSPVHWHDGKDRDRREECASGKYDSPESREDCIATKAFWAAVQRFFKVLQVTAKVSTVVRRAKRDVAEGKSVVISMWSTGESRQTEVAVKAIKDAMKEDVVECLDDVEMSDGRLLSGLALLPIHTLDKWVKTQRLDHDGNLVEIDEFKNRKEYIKKLILEAQLPSNPLDQVIEEFGGPEHVAELTGRRKRWEKHPVSGGHKKRYVDRGTYRLLSDEAKARASARTSRREPDGERDGSSSTASVAMSMNNKERRHFQEGDKHVAVITEAASAGISLHCDKSLARLNSRPRVMYTLELPWSADKAVQQFGRIHRSNQLHCPRFNLVVTDMGSELRFTSTVARRMKMLGALTHGDRRATMGEAEMATLQDCDAQRKEGKEALAQLYNLITRAKDESESFAEQMDLSFVREGQRDDIDDNASDSGQSDKGQHQQHQQHQQRQQGGGGEGEGAEGDMMENDQADDDDHTTPTYLKHFDSFKEFATESHKEMTLLGIKMCTERDEHGNRLKSTDIRTFLNRLLMMQPHIQNSLHEWLMFLIAEQESIGKSSDKDAITDLNRTFRGAAHGSQTVTFTRHEVIATDPHTNAQTLYTKVVVDRGLPWASARDLYAGTRKSKDRFGRRRDPHKKDRPEGFYWWSPQGSNRALPILVIQKRETIAAERRFVVYRPSVGASAELGKHKLVTLKALQELTDANTLQKVAVTKVGGVDDLSRIEQPWTEWYDRTKHFCHHIQYSSTVPQDKLNAKGQHVLGDGSVCRSGMRKMEAHIISGNVLHSFGFLDRHFKADKKQTNDTKGGRNAAVDDEQQEEGDGGEVTFFKTKGSSSSKANSDGQLQISRATASAGRHAGKSIVGVEVEPCQVDDVVTMVGIIENHGIFTAHDPATTKDDDADDVEKMAEYAERMLAVLASAKDHPRRQLTSIVKIIAIDETSGTTVHKPSADVRRLFQTGNSDGADGGGGGVRMPPKDLRATVVRLARALVQHLKAPACRGKIDNHNVCMYRNMTSNEEICHLLHGESFVPPLHGCLATIQYVVEGLEFHDIILAPDETEGTILLKPHVNVMPPFGRIWGEPNV